MGSLLFLSMAMLASCDQEYTPLSNCIYIGEAQNSNEKNVTIEENGGLSSIFLSLSSPSASQVSAVVISDKSVLDNYNSSHGTNYALLPESYYELLNNECIIEPGKLSSSLVEVKINPFDDTLDPAAKYAIPVRIASSKGASILESSSNMIILCDKVIHQQALFLDGGGTGKSPMCKCTIPQGTGFDDLNTWTLEFMINCESFGTNKHVLRFDGTDGKAIFFGRFGQFDHPQNEFQMTYMNIPISGVTLFEPKKWYHIAVTCDGPLLKLYVNGKLDLAIDNPEPTGKMTWRMVSFVNGNASAFSEARVWNVARTQIEISTSMYAVNPETEGLIGYWKMNDGPGSKEFKDYKGPNNLDILKDGGVWKMQKFPPEE